MAWDSDVRLSSPGLLAHVGRSECHKVLHWFVFRKVDYLVLLLVCPHREVTADPS